MSFVFDGNVGDIATVGVAALAIFIRPIRRTRSGGPCFNTRDCILDCLNGSTVVPFALLVGAAMSTTIAAEIVKTSKVSMAIAGLIGLIFLVREFSAP